MQCQCKTKWTVGCPKTQKELLPIIIALFVHSVGHLDNPKFPEFLELVEEWKQWHGQFHGKVDMTLKFQVYHIAKKLLIMFYPWAIC